MFGDLDKDNEERLLENINLTTKKQLINELKRVDIFGEIKQRNELAKPWYIKLKEKIKKLF